MAFKNDKPFVATLALAVSVISCQSILPYSLKKRNFLYLLLHEKQSVDSEISFV